MFHRNSTRNCRNKSFQNILYLKYKKSHGYPINHNSVNQHSDVKSTRISCQNLFFVECYKGHQTSCAK